MLVLDGGRNVEHGEVWRVFGNPQADATQALLRPLQHDLPADLAARLVPDLAGRPGVAVLRLRFTCLLYTSRRPSWRHRTSAATP